MNREQERKFDRFYEQEKRVYSSNAGELLKGIYKQSWQACLEANGIEDGFNVENAKKILKIIDESQFDWADLKKYMTDKLNECDSNSIKTPDPLVIDLRKVEWPEWAEALQVTFWEHEYGFFTPPERFKTIASIPRPAPAWKPKEGEAVFVTVDDDYTVGVIKDSCNGGQCFNVYVNGRISTWGISKVKPFDPAKIGLPWDQI